jgi:hypothetical protein
MEEKLIKIADQFSVFQTILDKTLETIPANITNKVIEH